MLEIYRSAAQVGLPILGSERDELARVQLQLVALYRRARAQGWRRTLWSQLAHRSNSLRQLPAQPPGEPAREPKVRAVPLARIVGSEDRTRDFDRGFAPLQEHTRTRWLNVATAWALGQALPAVELIQIGDDYYVRDGHHRISVASAFGQSAIDAQVLVWRPAAAEGASAPLVRARAGV